MDQHLIAALAREMLGRTDIAQEVLAETASRLEGVLAKVRLADEAGLQATVPAISFDPAHPHYQQAPREGAPPWERMAQAGGGTGYGGSMANTGAPAAPSGALRGPSNAKDGPDFLWLSATEMAAAIRRRELSPVELTRATLERLAAVDKQLNAFVTVMADQAMAQARAMEGAEPRGPLHGVPVALKDLYETAGVRTTGGSRILADNVPTTDATTVTRLREAGAIILGKTATHEFAFGALTDSPYHGPTHNPWDLSRVPGGSSGGSGAAVAAGVIPIAMGTDTGGSIRMPAGCCGIVGLKPTYGRVSKAGILPLSWSLDHAGPLTRSVSDAALVLGVIAGPDPFDPTALPVPLADYFSAAGAQSDLRGIRIGLPEAWLEASLDPGVATCFADGLRRLTDLGAEIVPVTLPPADVMTLVNRLLALSEAASYHAPFLKDRADLYAPDVRLRLELGQYLLARDYLMAHRLRTEMTRHLHAVMADVHALVTPTMPIPSPRIGQPVWEYGDGSREPVGEAMIRYVAPFSVSGQPAFSLPCGFTPQGLPVGLQLVGRAFGEFDLIRIARAFEQAGTAAPRPAL